MSTLALLTPLTDTVERKAVMLASPVLFSIWLTLLRPVEGLAAWALGLTILVSQTGYQLDIGRLRTSALEIVLIFLLLLLFYLRRYGSIPRLPALPGARLFLVFALYALALFAFSLLQAIPLERSLLQFKGFLLYPLLAYPLLAGVQSHRLLRWTFLIIVVWFLVVAGVGMEQFWQGNQGIQANQIEGPVARASGEYAPINIFGVTLAAVALLVLGISLGESSPLRRTLGIIVVCVLFLGAATSVSRTIWLAFAVGLVMLLLLRRRSDIYLPVLLIVGLILLLIYLPNPVAERILQLSDSSTVRRFSYLESGWRAWLASPVWGWGWGNAFWYRPGIGLLPTGGVPWYHNDYLNLAVQTGAIGLILYLLFWLKVIWEAGRWLQRHPRHSTAGYVLGSTVALVAMLVAGMFEHVLWRTDSAGLLGWLFGMMVAGMNLGRTAEEQ